MKGVNCQGHRQVAVRPGLVSAAPDCADLVPQQPDGQIRSEILLNRAHHVQGGPSEDAHHGESVVPAAVPDRDLWGATAARRCAGGGRDLPHQTTTGSGMLTELVAEGSLPVRWVTCDEGYGRSVDFLDGVRVLGLSYRAEVPVDTRLWPTRPPTVVPHTWPRLVSGAPPSLKARVLAAQLPADARTRHRGPGISRGPEYANFAIRWVVASRGSLSEPEVWLVRHRQPGANPIRVFLCHAHHHIQLARAGPSRPASGKASSYWIWPTTRAAAGRAGIVTGPCTCSCSRTS